MTCSAQQSWHVYVPVSMKILTKVVVARETIPGKTLISEDMLDYAYRDKNTLYSGYFKETKDVVDQVPISTVVAGTALTRHNVQQPVIVNRNQAVTIISKHGHIMVSAEGIAKTEGALNDTIKVMNSSSKKTIDAIVTSGTTVEVRA
jgi:flagella basal body P-ring formation protein FlgA